MLWALAPALDEARSQRLKYALMPCPGNRIRQEVKFFEWNTYMMLCSFRIWVHSAENGKIHKKGAPYKETYTLGKATYSAVHLGDFTSKPEP